MGDILYNAAIEYKKLMGIIYRIVVGRKGKAYHIMLHFLYADLNMIES